MPPKPGADKPAPLPPPKKDPEPPKTPKEPLKCEECLGSEGNSIIPRNAMTGEKIPEKECIPPKYSRRTCETVKPAANVTSTYCAVFSDKIGSIFPKDFSHEYKDNFFCKTQTARHKELAGRCFGWGMIAGP